MEESNTQAVGQTVVKLNSGAPMHKLTLEDRSKGGKTLTTKRLNTLKIVSLKKSKCKNCPIEIRSACWHYIRFSENERKTSFCRTPALKNNVIEVLMNPEKIREFTWLLIARGIFLTKSAPLHHPLSQFQQSDTIVKRMMEFHRTFGPKCLKELHLHQTNIENNKIIAILDKNPDIKEKILNILEKEERDK